MNEKILSVNNQSKLNASLSYKPGDSFISTEAQTILTDSEVEQPTTQIPKTKRKLFTKKCLMISLVLLSCCIAFALIYHFGLSKLSKYILDNLDSLTKLNFYLKFIAGTLILVAYQLFLIPL